EDAHVLVVVVELFEVVRRHDADHGADAVGEFAALVPVGRAVAGGVLLAGVGTVLVKFVKVRHAVAVRVGIGPGRGRAGEGRTGREGGGQGRRLLRPGGPRSALPPRP